MRRKILSSLREKGGATDDVMTHKEDTRGRLHLCPIFRPHFKE